MLYILCFFNVTIFIATVVVLVLQIKMNENIKNLPIRTVVQHSEEPKPTMDDKQVKDFLDADREAAQSFLNALADLNAFMTGKEEENAAEAERQSA